jgi:predicted amidophosphoribosyltransferase
MPLASCPRCEKLFERQDAEVCPACRPDEEADSEKVRDLVEAQPGLSAEAVSEETGVGVDVVLRLIDQGRIANVAVSGEVVCGRCGAPAISTAKRLCQKCLSEMNIELAKAKTGLGGSEPYRGMHSTTDDKT